MEPGILELPLTENRAQTLGATSFLSLVFHGLLIGALGVAVPLERVKTPEDSGISLDLTTIDIPAAPLAAAPPVAEEVVTPEAPSEPPVAEVPEPLPVPKKVEAPKPKPVPRKTAVATSKRPAPGPASPNSSAPVTQTAAKAPGGQTSRPAPEGGSSTPRPPYPDLARKRGQEGTVRVLCHVDATGKVTNVAVAQSSGFRLLDEAALKAVGKWKFKPGKKDGVSVADTVIVPVQFKLE